MQSSVDSTVRKRLADAKGTLDYLETERARRADPNFGVLFERQIIWRELLELELEEAEERITMMCDAAERALDLLA